MLPGYFDYIFVHLRQKARLLRPELSSKYLSTLGPAGPNPNPTRKVRRDLQLYFKQYGAF